MVRTLIATTITLVVLVATGFVHGWQTGRWSSGEVLMDAASRLDKIPATIGTWTSTDAPIGERQLAGAEAVGNFSRQYTNSEDGSVVNVMILCGRFGPISVHPPTVCFTGSGYYLREKESAIPIKNSDSQEFGEFWVGDFVKNSEGVTQAMRTFWGWYPGDKWHAPDNPRMEFAGRPFLYKMYVTRALNSMSTEGLPEDNDSAIEFMRLILPVLEETLAHSE